MPKKLQLKKHRLCCHQWWHFKLEYPSFGYTYTVVGEALILKHPVWNFRVDVELIFSAVSLTLIGIWKSNFWVLDFTWLKNRTKYPFKSRLIPLIYTTNILSNLLNNSLIGFRFAAIWNEIEALWFILTKELIRAAQNDKLVKDSILQSRLPNKIVDLLSCKTIDREIAENYHLFNAFLSTAK